jgi:hypothetical protein
MAKSQPKSKKAIVYWYHDTNRKPDSTGSRKGNSRLKYNWHLIDPKIKQVLADRKAQGLETTERKLFYVLSNLEGEGVILPGIKKTYQSLIARMSELRYAGILSMDCVVDDRHEIKGNDGYPYNTPEDYVAYYIDKIHNIDEWYHQDDNEFPRWWKQKNHVEIWIEKEAMTHDVLRIVENYDLQVKVLAFGGIAGTTTLNDACKRLRKKIDTGKNIRILYFGDYDSTGQFIDKDIERRLTEYHTWRLTDDDDNIMSLDDYAKKQKPKLTFTIERIAITKEQITQYNLPWDPDKMPDEVQQKIENDPRTAGMILREGKKYAASLDAFPALHLQEFEDLVIDAVNDYFSEDLYQQNLQEHKEKYNEQYIKNTRNDLVKEFAKELEEEEEDEKEWARRRSEDEDEDEGDKVN